MARPFSRMYEISVGGVMTSMRKEFADGLKAELKRLILEGRSQVYCAYKLGVSESAVSLWIREMGLVELRAGEKRRRIAQMFYWSYKGLRPKEIAAKLNLPVHNVYYTMKYWGAPEKYHLIRPYLLKMEGLDLLE